MSVAFNNLGTILASAGDKTIRLWNIETYTEITNTKQKAM